MPTILVATASGLRAFDASGGEQPASFESRSVGALAAGGTQLWAVVDGREIWKSGDGDWQHIADLELGLEAKSLAHTRANPEGGILVGTSEARLMRVTDNPQMEVVDAFDLAPGRDDWFTPWGGPPDTRSITGDGDAVYVNVHVGGILRSRDVGATWQQTIDIDADIHRVVTAQGRVYAAGARGLSTSSDGGDTWSLSAEGLHAAYCRGVAVCGEASWCRPPLARATAAPRSTGRINPARGSNAAGLVCPSGSRATSTASASMLSRMAASPPSPPKPVSSTPPPTRARPGPSSRPASPRSTRC